MAATIRRRGVAMLAGFVLAIAIGTLCLSASARASGSDGASPSELLYGGPRADVAALAT